MKTTAELIEQYEAELRTLIANPPQSPWSVNYVQASRWVSQKRLITERLVGLRYEVAEAPKTRSCAPRSDFNPVAHRIPRSAA